LSQTWHNTLRVREAYNYFSIHVLNGILKDASSSYLAGVSYSEKDKVYRYDLPSATISAERDRVQAVGSEIAQLLNS
jgi:hypothetical protein